MVAMNMDFAKTFSSIAFAILMHTPYWIGASIFTK
jgi:hypothetical protein